jgi:transcriptional regulator with XRE-family HTH domain
MLPPRPSFGQRLRELRKAKKMSQRDLAECVATRLRGEDGRGFDFTYLSKIENGKLPPPSTTVILALAAELMADSDELLALAKKAPADIGETLRNSPGARVFYRSAVNLQLSEDQWRQLIEKLRELEQEDCQ